MHENMYYHWNMALFYRIKYRCHIASFMHCICFTASLLLIPNFPYTYHIILACLSYINLTYPSGPFLYV